MFRDRKCLWGMEGNDFVVEVRCVYINRGIMSGNEV